MINETSSAGNPSVSKTITIVTKPACGMPAAPIEAIVAVTLKVEKKNRNYKIQLQFES